MVRRAAPRLRIKTLIVEFTAEPIYVCDEVYLVFHGYLDGPRENSRYHPLQTIAIWRVRLIPHTTSVSLEDYRRRRIAFFGDVGLPEVGQRFEGYERVLAKHDLAATADLPAMNRRTPTKISYESSRVPTVAPMR
jgi:hypothetical protein